MPRRDEDALSWDGDDDPTLDTGVPAPTSDVDPDGGVADSGASGGGAAADLPEGWTAVGRGSGSVSHTGTVPAAASDAPPRPPMPTTSSPAGGTSAATGAAETSAQNETPRTPETPATTPSPDPDDEPAPLGTTSLVSIGVLGGVYLLFAIGWLVGGLRLQGRYQVLVTDSMYQGALWLATAAPLIWFATTIFATRTSRGWVRWVWLIVGVILLLPWPFLMIGAVGR